MFTNIFKMAAVATILAFGSPVLARGVHGGGSVGAGRAAGSTHAATPAATAAAAAAAAATAAAATGAGGISTTSTGARIGAVG
ncbi:hypothetical protein ABTK92_19610, partial [Acinetobacter baumannii]